MLGSLESLIEKGENERGLEVVVGLASELYLPRSNAVERIIKPPTLLSTDGKTETKV